MHKNKVRLKYPTVYWEISGISGISSCTGDKENVPEQRPGTFHVLFYRILDDRQVARLGLVGGGYEPDNDEGPVGHHDRLE